jgi:hypothetical protein
VPPGNSSCRNCSISANVHVLPFHRIVAYIRTSVRTRSHRRGFLRIIGDCAHADTRKSVCSWQSRRKSFLTSMSSSEYCSDSTYVPPPRLTPPHRTARRKTIALSDRSTLLACARADPRASARTGATGASMGANKRATRTVALRFASENSAISPKHWPVAANRRLRTWRYVIAALISRSAGAQARPHCTAARGLAAPARFSETAVGTASLLWPVPRNVGPQRATRPSDSTRRKGSARERR